MHSAPRSMNSLFRKVTQFRNCTWCDHPNMYALLLMWAVGTMLYAPALGHYQESSSWRYLTENRTHDLFRQNIVVNWFGQIGQFSLSEFFEYLYRLRLSSIMRIFPCLFCRYDSGTQFVEIFENNAWGPVFNDLFLFFIPPVQFSRYQYSFQGMFCY